MLFFFLFLTLAKASEKVFLCPPMFSESQHLKGKYQELEGDFYLQKMDHFPVNGALYSFKLFHGLDILSSFLNPYYLKTDFSTLIIEQFKINSVLLPLTAKDSDSFKLPYRTPARVVKDFYMETYQSKLCIETNEAGEKYILNVFPEYFKSLDFLTFKDL